jgi:hypothetical protein
MPKILIIDRSTGEKTVREMNAEETAEYEKSSLEPTTESNTDTVE